MTIILNQKPTELSGETATVAALAAECAFPAAGVAVAVNNSVVPRAAWESTSLSDGDKVTVITAVCGG